MNRGLASSEWFCTVPTKSSYPDMGVCEMNPLTGVGIGESTVGMAAGSPLGGDCSKNGGVVVVMGRCRGLSSGGGFCSCWTGCEMDGFLE